ncbi:MAG: formate dehydrogenase accessory sulfurtransferase FdhD [Clostridia bacterium]
MKEFGTAVILAGGQSTRMGFDKQYLQLNNQNIISYLSEKLSIIFDDIIVVSNTLETGDYNTFRVVSDVIKDKGPLSGIHSGLLSAKSEFIYFIACDMPNINLDYIRFMIEEIESANNQPLAIVTRFKDWIEPFNSFYHKKMIDLIENYLKANQSIYELIKKVDSILIEESIAREYSPDWDMFINLNTFKDVKEFMNKNKVTEFHKIQKFENGFLTELNDEVIVEKPIKLFVNKKHITTFSCSPHNLKSLAIGHLLTKNIISSITLIDSIYIGKNCIQIKAAGINITKFSTDVYTALSKISPLDENFLKSINYSLDTIISIMKEFSTYSKTFLKTGAAHSTAFLDKDKIVLFSEDIARHNAVDKLIGNAHINQINTSKLAILTSCRVSGEIISKVITQKIPVLISQSAPSNIAIEFAKKYKVTLIGFARKNRLNIYTNFINLA